MGLIAGGVATGYEMKVKIDAATRFFWGASPGGIYPELNRLAASGLVDVREVPHGGRRRREYSLTETGRATYERWLHSDDELTFELRHEGLLKLFLIGGDANLLQAVATHHRVILARLRAIDAPDDIALRFGRDLNAFAATWFAQAAEQATTDGSSRATSASASASIKD